MLPPSLPSVSEQLKRGGPSFRSGGGEFIHGGSLSPTPYIRRPRHTFCPKNGRDRGEPLKARHIEAIRQQHAGEQQDAYLLLIKSGDEYFQKRQFEWAIEEYSKAAELSPEAMAPIARIARSYKYLCEYYGQSCEKVELYQQWLEE